jgi:hypothetical protein
MFVLHVLCQHCPARLVDLYGVPAAAAVFVQLWAMLMYFDDVLGRYGLLCGMLFQAM